MTTTPEAAKAATIERIQRLRVSAIIRTKDRSLAADAMKAAVDGGFQICEFTLTTPGALELISEFSKRDELLIGAGTVLTPEQATAARDAGARYAVSPVCDPDVIHTARELGLAVIPGTFTPTEMIQAHRAGADFVKLFPAPANVAESVTAILGPLPFLKIFPTAGVDADNFLAVLRAGAAGVGFVRSLFDPSDLAERRFDRIKRRAAEIIQRAESAS